MDFLTGSFHILKTCNLSNSSSSSISSSSGGDLIINGGFHSVLGVLKVPDQHKLKNDKTI